LATKINKNKVIAAAQKYVQKGQHDKAIKEYAKIVEEDPRDVRIWLKIGDLQVKKDSTSEAVETYSKVAEFYSEQGFYLKAVAVYKQILKIDANLVEINLRLAELYKQLGLLSDAMQQYEQVSNFYHQAGRTKEALAALRQIVDLDPQNVASRIKLAELYSKEQMRDEAVEEFAKAADFLRAENRIDDFVKVAERLVFHQPDNLAVTKELAGIYLRKRDPRRALQKLQLAFKADPRDEETLNMLAQAFEDLGQVPKTVSVLKELAHIHAENGNDVKRREIYQRILVLSPNDDEARGAMVGESPAPRVAAEFAPAPTVGGPAPRVQPRPAEGRPTQGEAFAVPGGDYYDEGAGGGEGEGYGGEPDYDYSEGQQRAPERLEEVSSAQFEEYGIEEEVEDDRRAPAHEQPGADFAEEVAKILTEADVYIKYGLHEKAVDHLRQVFTRDPDNLEVHLKLKELYLQLGRYSEAARELLFLGHQSMSVDRRQAAAYLNEALELDPGNREARSVLSALEGSSPESSDKEFEVESQSEPIDLAAEDIVEEIPISGSGRDYRSVESGEGRGGAPMGPPVPQDASVPEAASWPAQEDYNDDFRENDYSGSSTPSDRPVPRKGSGLIELHGETTDTLGGGTPSSEIIHLGVDHTPSASQLRVRAEEESANLEDDLDEAEFFIQQGLLGEARNHLEELASRHPGNPLVQGKLEELEAIEGKGGTETVEEPSGRPVDSSSDLASELAAELEASGEPAGSTEVGGGSFSVEDVFQEFKHGIEGQVSDEDSDTHYDLGIAYREMGLMDDAIAEFKIAMRSREKEALCHMMIGLCYIEKDLLSEAISQFKTGLYVEGITDRETIALYFELGQAYERLDDAREALYYYEKVAKKDARFRDVGSRIDRLREAAGGNGESSHHDAEGETEDDESGGHPPEPESSHPRRI
jgi:pilus assembly protein FimV